jgi:hypothetical protein
VAGRATIGGLEVGRGFAGNGLAGGMGTIMTGEASTCRKSMIHACWHPFQSVVAILAGSSRRNVQFVFAKRVNVIVAGRAGCGGGLRMVKLGDRLPPNCSVAAFASVRGVQMFACQCQFAGGSCSIVTGHTSFGR